MILVVAGTADGRQLAESIRDEGYRVLLSVATPYGESLAGGLQVRCGGLDEEGFAALIKERKTELVVDASHPFAENVSKNVMAACKRSGIGYIRYERPGTCLPESPLLYPVCSYEEAAKVAASLGEVIFLTTGSNALQVFTQALQGKRLVARVLPVEAVVRKCLSLGLKPADIAAIQGPFSLEMNLAMLRHYGARVMVTKDSGEEGGTDAKLEAALQLGIPVVIVQRPRLDYPLLARDWPELKTLLHNN